MFRKHGKPIHVSHPAEDTGTETEGESSSAVSGYRYEALSGFAFSANRPHRRYPSTRFPRAALDPLVASQPVTSPSPLGKEPAGHALSIECFEVDESVSSPIPSPTFDPSSNVHLESLRCTSTSSDSMETTVEGMVLVRNLSYSKQVTCRFTLDEWSTTSNVSAQYVETLSKFPASYFPSQPHRTIGDAVGIMSVMDQMGDGEWDRFKFTFTVNHGVYSLTSRTVMLCVRFGVEGGEWWDNNGGKDYRIRFRPGVKVAVEQACVKGSEDGGMGSRGPNSSSPNSNGSNKGSKNTSSQGRSTTQSRESERWTRSISPIPHTSHCLLPIQPKRTSSPSPPRSYSPLAYPTVQPMLLQTKVDHPEWNLRGRWAVGEFQRGDGLGTFAVVACKV